MAHDDIRNELHNVANMEVGNIKDDRLERIRMLSEIRGETIKDTASYVFRNVGFNNLPKKFLNIYFQKTMISNERFSRMNVMLPFNSRTGEY